MLDSQVRKSDNDLDHNTFALKPGLLWNAKKQCEILLKDSGAYAMNSTAHSNICENLMCQSVHKSGFYHAGPALDGTKCDEDKVGNVMLVKSTPNGDDFCYFCGMVAVVRTGEMRADEDKSGT